MEPNSKRGRRVPLWFIGLIISIVAFYFAVRKVQWNEFLQTCREVSPGWLLLAVFCILVNCLCRAARWKGLLGKLGSYRLLQDCFTNYMIGYMANMLFPLKAGELVRPVLFGKKHGVSRTSVFALVVSERLLDMIFLSVFFLLAVLLGMNGMEAKVEEGIGWIALLSVTVFVVAAFLSLHEGSRKLIGELARRVGGKWGHGLVERILNGLSGVMEWRPLTYCFLTTTLLWGCTFATTVCYLNAFHLDLPWFAPVFIIVVVNFGMIVPSTPAAIGIAHGLFVFALGIFHVDPSTALGFAVFAHGVGFLVVTVTGLACTAWEGFSMRELADSKGLMSDQISDE